MINLDSIINENNKEHNEKWPCIPDHPYRILITGGSRSRKTNTLLNLINEQRDIDKIYLYAKDLSEPKYEYLIKNCENAGIKHVNDDMIADIVINKKFQAIIKELFIRCRKINISLVFITQSYFSVPKDVKIKFYALFYYEDQ